jgi:phage gp45-like
MSYTDSTTRQWRAETSPDARDARGLVRRMVVNLTTGVFWRTVGHLLLDGTPELHNAEVFSGVGFYARPKSGHNAEAIVVFPGGGSNPIIIATRDEDARKAMAKLDADETAVFNSRTVIVIKKGGTEEIRAAGGTAEALATKADVAALRATYNNHTHLYSPGTGAAIATPKPVAQADAPSGTSILKAQ